MLACCFKAVMIWSLPMAAKGVAGAGDTAVSQAVSTDDVLGMGQWKRKFYCIHNALGSSYVGIGSMGTVIMVWG
jgi:hypothetical protein